MGDSMEKDLELKKLDTFIGTLHYYRYFGIFLTDGIKYIMENGYAWFVNDIIALLLSPTPKLRKHLQKDPFLVIHLKVNTEKAEADMIIEDGNGNTLYKQHYKYTDAKRDLKLYYIDNVLMLSSEY